MLADDYETGYETDAHWKPELYQWQQETSNVLFFTFINPRTMKIPPSFKSLAASRGTGFQGSVPNDTLIIFAMVVMPIPM